MASSREFVEYVCEQLSEAGTITYKNMFGEFGIYCNGQYFASICNDMFLVKMTKEGEEFLGEYETGFPYEGAKPCFLITDLDNREKLAQLASITCQALPIKKPKKKR